MKKIYAIALALVMVLSMASAFASACVTGPFNWTDTVATDYCGKGSIEVVPYVKVNTACDPYYSFEANTCAAAVAQENVYYALKLTVDANADDAWWNIANLTMTYKNVTTQRTVVDPVWATLKAAIKANDTVGVANTFYYNFVGDTWDLVTTTFEFNNAQHLDLTAVATKPSAAKVCAKLESENLGVYMNRVGKYDVNVADDYSLIIISNKDNAAEKVTYTVENGRVTKVDFDKACSASFYEEVKAFFGLDVNSYVNKDNVKAAFGWKDKLESCFSWSDKAVAAVNPDCVVAIPKTGDMSVLAWLF